MSNITKKIIALALFAVLMVTSLGFGIYTSVKASEYKAVYDEKITISHNFEKRYEKAANSDNPLLGSKFLQDIYKKKAEETAKAAEEAKSGMKKYFAYSAILIFVACAMAVCVVIMGLSIKKYKAVLDQYSVPDTSTADNELSESIENKDEDRRKSDFDIILEAPKPHISDEE